MLTGEDNEVQHLDMGGTPKPPLKGKTNLQLPVKEQA